MQRMAIFQAKILRSILATVAGCTLIARQPPLQAVPSRPNVLVFLVDDLGVMDTALRDQGFYETPNVTRLAESGMRFLNGYCAHPRCVPSRYAIQTGRFPCRDAMNSRGPEKSMQKNKTIAEAFKENGYATFFTGKWHLGKEEADFPHHRGYDVNLGGCHAGAPGSYFFPFHVDRKKGQAGKYGPLHGLASGEQGEHLTDRLTRETAKWIRRQVADNKGRPFFAFLSHYAVHTPIEGKPDEVAHFQKKVARLPAVEGSGFQPVDGQTKTRRDNAKYASMVKTMDDSVGAILDLLDELGIAGNTIVAFTSDHGGLSNRGTASRRDVATSNLPFRAGKGHLYEGGLRVPLIVSFPGQVKGGSVSAAPAVGSDLYPTLLGLAGLELQPKAHADGVNLVPALTGKELVRRRPIIWHSPRPRPTQTGDIAASVIRVGDLKLVKNYFPVSMELYDLKTDPYERKNLAATRAKEAGRLRERLENILTRFQATAPRQDWKNPKVTAPLKGG
jgi:arylsulfatase A-like enzyme